LESQSIRPIFLTGNMPDRTEPKTQRLLRFLKDCARYNRCLKTTPGTFVQANEIQMENTVGIKGSCSAVLGILDTLGEKHTITKKHPAPDNG